MGISTQTIMIKEAYILSQFVFCTVFANIPYTVRHNLASRDVKEDFYEADSKTLDLFDEPSFDKGMMLKSCQVQKHVLARLRDLVVDSIAQVKLCMEDEAQMEKHMRTLSTSLFRI